MLLLRQLSGSCQKELELIWNICKCHRAPLVEETVKVEIVLELLGISWIDKVGRSLEVSPQKETADEFHINLTLFLMRADTWLRKYQEEPIEVFQVEGVRLNVHNGSS